MMKGIIKNTAALFLAAILLIATSGFTVFRHSCRMANTTEFTLIVPEFNCNHNGHKHEKGLPPCCSTSESDDAASCDTDKCCNTETFVLKLNITVDIQHFNNNAPILSLILPEVIETGNCPDDEETNPIIISNDLPPPLSGKALHIFLQQLDIPSYSV